MNMESKVFKMEDHPEQEVWEVFLTFLEEVLKEIQALEKQNQNLLKSKLR